MKSDKKMLLVLGIACLACCAPLVGALFAGFGAAAIGFLVTPSAHEMLLYALPFGAFAFSYVVYRRMRAKRRLRSNSAANGTSCDVKACCGPSGDS